jgi:hypothetical protein
LADRVERDPLLPSGRPPDGASRPVRGGDDHDRL